MAGFTAMQNAAKEGKNCVTDTIPCQVASIAESVKTKMDVFGCINRV